MAEKCWTESGNRGLIIAAQDQSLPATNYQAHIKKRI